MIDLRSDTVTRPTEEMRRVMLGAMVGDDVFGEDPTVNRLEEYVAVLLGKGAALYCPSGTMTNQIAVHVATDRGDEVILHEDAHIFNYEAGAPAFLSGVPLRPVSGKGGIVSPRIEVRLFTPHEHAEPLSLLEEYMRDGKPVPPPLAEQLQRVIKRVDLEVFAARTEERLVGIAVLAFRPNVSAGTLFASIEDLYVRLDTRRWGVGQVLVEAMGERCKVRGVSYVEVQTDDEAAEFYSVLGYEPQHGVRVLSRSCTL